ncbi:hypothetical protein B8A22_09380 [Staphylococcus aureus]|nr:hypothetical protein B8A22_09380 [Staphylococcus aureus]ORT78266.1 hypothetical protein B6V77_08755 [Staphylococcus aureus]
MFGPRPQLSLPVEFLYEILCVDVPPTSTLLKSDFPSAFMLGPVPNFHCLLKFFKKFSVLGPANSHIIEI